MFLFFGCNQQPIGNTLLSSGNTGNSVIDTTTTTDEDGTLDIQPDNAEMTINVDDSDKIEITGTCKDLDRKKNRILVEVFAGEDETVTPYISNDLSDKCQTAAADIPIGDKCFWVTKGVGVIENAGLPDEKSFPQCHNGRFGFAVKLGKVLVQAAGANLKYTVRFKLRTLDGLLSDSTFGRVSVARGLNVPVIDSATPSTTTIQCDIKTSPARFNFGIQYALKRTYTDSKGVTGAPVNLYSNWITDNITVGMSVFSYNDFPLSVPLNIMLQGVTYNYTLESAESYFSYAPLAAPTKSSSTVSCETARPQITQTDPGILLQTCPMKLLDNTANPLSAFGQVTYEWGYNTTNTWVGPTFSAQTGFTVTTGLDCAAGATTCTESGPQLQSKKSYFFAVREIGNDGQIGKWSNTFECKPN